MRLKNGLLSLVACAALSFGYFGCKSDYVSFEKKGCSYVKGFSRKIPDSFIKDRFGWQGKSLVFEDEDNYGFVGEGRFVVFQHNEHLIGCFEFVGASYVEADEMNESVKTEDVDNLNKNMLFGNFKFDYDSLKDSKYF